MKTRKTPRFIGMLLSLMLFSALLHPTKLRFERINRYQGFPDDSVNTIFQDRYGIMWIGCDEGLLRYDGQTFRLLRPKTEGTQERGPVFSVSSIIQDAQGTFWIGTYNSGLYTLNPNSETFRSESYLPPSSGNGRYFIYRLMQDTLGGIWISSWGFGISRYDPKTRAYTHYSKEDVAKGMSVNPFIRPVVERNDGSVWFGSDRGCLYRVDPSNQSLTVFQLYQDDHRTIPLEDTVFSLLFDLDDDLWVGTLNSGLYLCRFHEDRFTVIRRYQAGPGPKELGDNHIRDLLESSQIQGKIWICTDYGLYVLHKENGVFSRYLSDPNNSYSLSRNYLSCIFEDRTGLFWLGTINGGLMKFSPHPNSFNTQIPQLQDQMRSHSEVTSLLRLSDQKIVLGGLACALTLTTMDEDKPTGRQIHLLENALNSNRIRALAADPGAPDSLLVGTSWSGLKRVTFSGETFAVQDKELPVSPPQDGVPNTINDILPFPSGNTVWYATNRGLYVEKNNQINPMIPDPLADSASGSRIIRLYHDGDGIVWIGTQSGISLYSTKKESYIPLENHLEPLRTVRAAVRSFHKASNGEFWIGTDSGLIRIPKSASTSIQFMNREDGLADHQILTIQSDRSGSVWLGTPMGLSRYDPISKRFFNYDLFNGLDNHWLSCSLYNAEQDLMIFGGINGITTFHPRQIRPMPYPPAIVFTGFETIDPRDGSHAPLPMDTPSHLIEKISIKQGAPLIIHFSAMDFSAPRKNQYQYRLLGYEDQWRFTPSGQPRAQFHALPSGNYHFEVKGSNSDGIWNAQGARLQIEVIAPWWKTPFSLGMFTLLTAVALVILYRKRIHILTFRKNEKEKLQIFYNAHSISQREIEIINLIIAGHSNKEIEDILFISLPTVKSHIYHIYKKLGVSSRSQLLAVINRFKRISDS